MESENDEQSDDRGAQQPQDSQQPQPPRGKLRDLRPEKDPMGAGKEIAPPVELR